MSDNKGNKIGFNLEMGWKRKDVQLEEIYSKSKKENENESNEKGSDSH